MDRPKKVDPDNVEVEDLIPWSEKAIEEYDSYGLPWPLTGPEVVETLMLVHIYNHIKKLAPWPGDFSTDDPPPGF